MSNDRKNLHEITVIVQDPKGNQKILRSASFDGISLTEDSKNAFGVQFTHDHPLGSHVHPLRISWEPEADDEGHRYTLESTDLTGDRRKIHVPKPIEAAQCSFCDSTIVRDEEDHKWRHQNSGKVRCYPKDLIATPKEGK